MVVGGSDGGEGKTKSFEKIITTTKSPLTFSGICTLTQAKNSDLEKELIWKVTWNKPGFCSLKFLLMHMTKAKTIF